ncbi:transmembrane amino acid transporter family protein [Wolffia australiana]
MDTRYTSVPVSPSVELQPFPDKADLPLIAPGPSPDRPAAAASAGVPGAVFNLTTTVVGAGIMALPAAMKSLGLLPGLLSIALLGALSELSIELLVRYAVLAGAATYGDLVAAALGRAARVAAETCIVVNNAGILIVYLIIVGDVLSGSPNHTGVLYQWLGRGPWESRALVILIVVLAVIAPLCSLEKIESLTISSAASVALAVFFVVVSCAMAAARATQGATAAPRLGPDVSSSAAVLELLLVIPIMTNAYVCHFNVQPIYNELPSPSPEKMNRVSRVTVAVCVAVYAATAVSGFVLFGDETEYDVLINFDRDLGFRFGSALNDMVRVGYVLHLVLVFPVIHFSLRETVGKAVFKGKGRRAGWKTAGLTAALLAAVYVGSTAVPNIGDAFKFTGATTGLALGFIFPALVALRMGDPGKKPQRAWENKSARAMLLLASVAALVGVAGNVFSLVKDHRS